MRTRVRIAGVAVFLLALTGAAAAAGPPWRLSVSANHRFLQRADGTPFFWLADTGWLLLGKLDRAGARHYLDDRRARRFNVIQVMVLHTADARAANGAPALVDGDPGRPLVTPGSDPADARTYDYWDHLDWVVREAERRGLYLALVPAWGALARTGALNESNVVAYASFLARRYRAAPNIVWLVGGDTRGNEQSEVWRAMGRTLRAEDPGHLITFHPFGRTQSSTWFHAEPWLDFNMFQSGHRRYDQDTDSPKRFGEDNWRYVLDDYAKAPPKPVLDGEPSYENIPQGLHDGSQPYWTAADARRYAYWSVFAGACGHTYGDNAVMQFHAPGSDPGAYSPRNYWFDAIHDPGAGQMKHLAALMLSRPYFDRVHDPEALVAGGGAGREHVIATRGRDYAMVYTYTGRPFEVRLGVISGATLRAWWYNPRDGSAQSAGLVPNTGVKRFVPPGQAAEGNDWVLVLDDVAKRFPPPGR